MPHEGLQSHPELNQSIPKTKEQLNCEAQGGKWDSVGLVCIMPEEPKPKFETIKDQDTGRLSGFKKGDDTFLGLNPADVRVEVEAEAAKRDLDIGGQGEAVIERQRQELQTEGLGLATEVGATPSDPILEQLQSEITADGLNYNLAFKSALPGILPDLASGAVAGATTAVIAGQAGPQVAVPEELLTVPALAGILGVANAVRGFYGDFMSNLKSQQSALVEGTIRTLSETKPTLNDIVNAQNANPENAQENAQAFDNQLAFIDLAYEDLKELTDTDLNAYLGEDGINQLKEYEVFYQLDGERDRLVFDMQLALSNPDPSRIRPTAIAVEDIKRRVAEL